MDHSPREGRPAEDGRDARASSPDEQLERTVALNEVKAFAETLPLPGGSGPRQPEPGAASVGPHLIGAQRRPQGPDESFDGARYGRYRPGGEPGGPGPEAAPHGPDGPWDGRPPRRRFSRRVLFTAGGLTLVGGCGMAAAADLSGRHSSSAAASNSPSASAHTPSAPGSPSHSPSVRAAQPTHTPSDLSSSSAGASTPSGGGKVAAAPEFYVHNGPKAIALTIDDGPSSEYTPKVLAVLAQHNITATFCMIGEQISANRSLVRELAQAGHAVVNHTWNHADQSKLSLASIRSQISRTNDELAGLGIHPSVFRAPYGAWSKSVFQACAQANLRPLDWSVDPKDWSRPGTSTIVSRILAHTRTGSIILEHDGGGDRSQTVAALKIVLPKLLDEGYRFTAI
ncbi:MAG: polysaccharide deacetylase family protein [Actinocrinis sp.]